MIFFLHNVNHKLQNDKKQTLDEINRINLRKFRSSSVDTPSGADFDFGKTTTGMPLHLAYSAPPQPAIFHFAASEPAIHITALDCHGPKLAGSNQASSPGLSVTSATTSPFTSPPSAASWIDRKFEPPPDTNTASLFLLTPEYPALLSITADAAVSTRAFGRSSNRLQVMAEGCHRLQVTAEGCRLVVKPTLLLCGFKAGLSEQRSPVPEEATAAASIGRFRCLC